MSPTGFPSNAPHPHHQPGRGRTRRRQPVGGEPGVLWRVGLVVAYLENQFYPDALERLSNALQEQGYHILIFMASGDSRPVEDVIEELLDYQVDGIVAASVSLSDDLAAKCEAAGIPVVLFNRGQDDPRLSEVTSDNVAGARQVAEFLLSSGHQRIAHISGWQGSTTGRDRARGFREALAESDASLVGEIDGAYKRDTAAEAARTLCQGPATPDAIFVGNDHMAFSVLDTLRFDLGLDVPGDVSVVGYDDVPMAAWPAYKLTTVRQPTGRMVASTVDTLLGRIEDRDAPPQKIRIAGELKRRATARLPEGTT